MWRRRLGVLPLRSSPSSSSTAVTSCQRRRHHHHLLTEVTSPALCFSTLSLDPRASRSLLHIYAFQIRALQEPLALNHLARLFTSQAGSDGDHSPKPFIAFILGGPGSGKGTQCTKIASDFGFAHLRAILELILDIIKEGRIVPSEISVRKAIEMNNANKVLIDGFPRYEKNRIAFERIVGTEPDIVIFFDRPEDEMVKCLLVHKSHGYC